MASSGDESIARHRAEQVDHFFLLCPNAIPKHVSAFVRIEQGEVDVLVRIDAVQETAKTHFARLAPENEGTISAERNDP